MRRKTQTIPQCSALTAAFALMIIALAACDDMMSPATPAKPQPAAPSDPTWSEESCPDVETLGEIRVHFTRLRAPVDPNDPIHLEEDPFDELDYLRDHPVLGALHSMHFSISNVSSVPVYVKAFLALQVPGPIVESSLESKDPTYPYYLHLHESVIEPNKETTLGGAWQRADGSYWYYGNYKLLISWADYLPEDITHLTPCSGYTALTFTTQVGLPAEPPYESTIVWDRMPVNSVSFWQFYNKHATTEAREGRIGRRAGEVTVYGTQSPGSPARVGKVPLVDVRPGGSRDRPTGYVVDCSKGQVGTTPYFENSRNSLIVSDGLVTLNGLSGCRPSTTR